MSKTFERFVALRYLRSKRKEVFISIITIISILGVAVSVMVLNIVLSVMTGFESELQGKLIDANAHIVLRRYGGDLDNYQALTERIRKLPHVTMAFPFTYNQAMLTTPQGARGVLIRGVADMPEARHKLAKLLPRETEIDRLFMPMTTEVVRPDGQPDEVVLPSLIIGKALAERMALGYGSTVTLFSPQMSSSPQGLIPKMKRFLVVSAYSSGLIEYENGMAYTSIEHAQSFFGMGQSVSGIEISVDDLFKAKEIGESIVQQLADTDPSLYATDWTEPNKPLWEAMKLEKQVYFIVLLLLILVASFSIVSTLVMVVMEKGRDIAILKSMGASDRSILSVFVLQGAAIGMSGIILGTLLGIGGSWALKIYGFPLDVTVFSLDRVPVHIIPMNFVVVAIAAFFITLGAGIYPARRAAKLRPAEALRFE